MANSFSFEKDGCVQKITFTNLSKFYLMQLYYVIGSYTNFRYFCVFLSFLTQFCFVFVFVFFTKKSFKIVLYGKDVLMDRN